jgi:UDP-N-acetylglucosamine--N-acetylmuramyl-(pentapeptide) pyrophosphoryl-undecaprenol N-acetylglucosamine transferase
MERAPWDREAEGRQGGAPLKVAFAGGGTGGHIYPALAIDQALRAAFDPEHYEPRFFGNRDGLEARLVTSMPLVFVPSAALQRKASLRALATLWTNLCGVAIAARALLGFRPAIVIATGGYACVPVLVAAKLLRALRLVRCALALLEINARPGLASRLVAPLVDEVWTAYAATATGFGAKGIATGTPVRASLGAAVHPSRARMALGLAPERATIVAMGGSQGARSINEAVAALVTRRTLGEDRQVLHLCGERDHAYIAAEEREVGANHVLLLPYLEDPANAYAAADVVIARAGASTLAELAATGTPAILVPYPHAADDHQAANAALFAERGAAIVVRDAELDGDRLWWALESIVRADRLGAMRKAARALGVPDAAAQIVRRIAHLVGATRADVPERTRGAEAAGANEAVREQS